MKALIDADLLVYRIGFTTQDEEEWIAGSRVDSLIDDILIETKAEDYKCFLTSSDKSNFRFAIYPEYKANRKSPKPIHYEFIRSYIQDKHPTEMIYGMEADDALVINQTENTVIVSIDKDLYQCPGNHFNFVSKDLFYISKEEGLCNFYKQILMGDMGSDNIPGCPGIGKAKAEKLLHSGMTEREMFNTVLETYKTQYKKKEIITPPLEDLIRNASLLKLKTTLEEKPWHPLNIGILLADSEYASTIAEQGETILSTEPMKVEESGMYVLGQQREGT